MEWCRVTRLRVYHFGLLIFTTFLLLSSLAFAESKDTHNLFVADFTGNQIPDLFFQGKTPNDNHTTYKVDEQLFTSVLQTWSGSLLGLNWDESEYKIYVGNFNPAWLESYIQSDLLLQSKSGGNSYIVYSENNPSSFDNPNYPDAGKFTSKWEIPANYLGIAWDTAASNIVPGKFTGTGVAELFIQGSNIDSSHYVVHNQQYLLSAGLERYAVKQTIQDGHLGLYWDAENIVPHKGDFNGDGYDDLFLQIKRNIVMTPMDDLVIPIVTNPDNTTLAIVTAERQGSTRPVGTFNTIWDSWENGYLGIDWSANNYNVVIADFNGDNRDDILLQSRTGDTNYLLQSDANGKFTAITQSWAGQYLGYDWSSGSSNINTADFNRDGRADIVLFDSNGPHTILADQDGTFTESSNILDDTVYNTQPYQHRSYPVVVGSSGGGFSVGANGTASYSMDIVTPPALAGMKPSLSMSYNSSGGNGIMGMGWSVGGLSSVMRCPRTYVEDGQIIDINFNLNDRLCLDGNRLTVVSGVYGQAGAEYRTEIDMFSRVTQMGGDIDTADAWFKVETKSGQIYEYGNTTDSEFNLKDTVPAYIWAVNKISDVANNEVSIEYFEDIERGIYRVDRINYTSINGGPASVRFIYEARTDVISAYVKGSPLITDKRLEAIETYVGENFVRSVEIHYDEGPTTGRSRVNRIQECSYDETCLPATVFDWTQIEVDDIWPSQHVATNICANGAICIRNSIWYLDFTGDGMADMCYRRGIGIHCFKSTGNGFDTQSQFNTGICGNSDPECGSYASYRTLNFVDMNNDNKVDIVYRSESGINIHLSNGNGFDAPIRTGLVPIPYGCGVLDSDDFDPPGCNESNLSIFYPDINGDGRVDMCYRDIQMGLTCYTGDDKNGEFRLFVASGICGSGDYVCYDTSSLDSIRFIDMNGDGRADIVYRTNTDGIATHYFNGTGFDSRKGSGICMGPDNCNAQRIYYVNITGDNLVDLCVLNSGGLRCYPNQGGFFTRSKFINTSLCANNTGCDQNSLNFVDFNLDGRADLTFRGASGLEIHLSTPGGQLFNKVANPTPDRCGPAPYSYGCDTADDNYYTVQYPDINGDGAPDQVIRGDDGVHVFFAAEFRQDMVTTITDGFSNQTTINYETLTNPDVYSLQGCVNEYPLQCVIGSLRVVRGYDASNGIGGMNTYRYDYRDLRVHLRGRGEMGYTQMNKYDLTNNTRDEIYDEDYTSEMVNDSYPDTYRYKGMGTRKLSYGPGDVLLSQTVNNFAFKYTTGQAYFPYYRNSTEQSWTPEGTLVSTVLIENDYSVDDVKHGNITSINTTTTDNINNVSFSNTTTNTYADVVDANNWQLARVSNTQVTHSTTLPDANGNPVADVTKESSFSYRANGQLDHTIIEPNQPEYMMTTLYGYDQYGNRDSVTVSGGVEGTISYVPERTTYTDITTNNGTSLDVQTTITNALGHSQTSTVDARTGVTINSTGPNGIPTSWSYDGFGRKLTELRADGTKSSISRHRCEGLFYPTSNGPFNSMGCPAMAVAYMVTSSTVSPTTRVYTDSMSRTVLSLSTNLDNGYDYSIKKYNNKGQMDAVYDVAVIPATALGAEIVQTNTLASLADPEIIATTSYDLFNRVDVTTDVRLGTTSTSTYSGATTTTTITGTDVPTRSTSKTTYANGNLKSSTDADGNAVLNFYDVQGNLKETHSPGKELGTLHKVIMTYDHKSRKIAMNDPDMGEWTYEYDAAGKLIKQTDAESNTLRNVYDLLDRQVLRVEAEGVSKWVYDNGYNAIGKLVIEAGPISMSAAVVNGFLTNPPTVDVIDETSAAFQRAFTYDEFGRGSTVTTTIEGIAFSMQTRYDQYSRVLETIYPTSTNNQRLVVSNVYDPTNRGYLIQVDRHLQTIDGTGATIVVPGSGQFIWKLGDNNGYNGAIDKYGKISKETIGNNITTNHGFDSSGRLTNRIASGLGTVQSVSYVYDSLNNLTQRTDYAPDAQVGLRANLVEDFTYDSLNRLKTVSLTGLPAQTAAILSEFDYYSNGNIKSKKHAGAEMYYWYESTRSHAVTRTSSDASGNTTIANYLYNNNGSMTSGDNRTLAYTSFNKPDVINKNGYNVQFSYDASHTRYKQISSNSTTYYLSARYDAGTHFEREIKTNGTINDVHFLYGGTGLLGTLTINNSNSQETRYYHKDHLGSIEVITDENQQVRAKVGYSPFGERRDSLTNLLEISGVIDPVTSNKSNNHHWYTGHEHLDETGIIHMNGRVYDPALGRFLSADPTIQFPGNTQSYNRYSYIMNNPMNATDPSGYSIAQFKSAFVGVTKLAAATFAVSFPDWAIGIGITLSIDMKFRRQSETYRQGATIVAAIFGPVTGGGSLVANAALNTWAVGGDTRDMVKAGMIAYATYKMYEAIGAGSNAGTITATQAVFLHGVVGGLSSSMQGGSFSSGFISGAVGKATTVGIADNIQNVVGKGIVVTISGGIVAELGGGKFSNGAMTAAMGYLLNEVATAVKEEWIEESWTEICKSCPTDKSKVLEVDNGNFEETKGVLQEVVDLNDTLGFKLRGIDRFFGIKLGARAANLIGNRDYETPYTTYQKYSEYLANYKTRKIRIVNGNTISKPNSLRIYSGTAWVRDGKPYRVYGNTSLNRARFWFEPKSR